MDERGGWLSAGALALWMHRMRRVALEDGRALPFALFAAAVALGATALAREPGWIGGALAIAGLALGLVWIGLGLHCGDHV